MMKPSFFCQNPACVCLNSCDANILEIQREREITEDDDDDDDP